jgi:hypothetical protein
MPTLTDAAPYYTGEALEFEAHPSFCRDTETIAQAAGKVKPNTVLGKITASGKYVPLAPGASDGSENAARVLIDGVDATAGDTKAAVWARTVVLNQGELNWGAANAGQITAAIAALKLLGIVVRPTL